VRLSSAGTVATVLGVLSLSSVATAPAATAGCAPAGSRVLASSGTARLYSAAGTLYGCLGTTRTRLGALASRAHFERTRVAAYALSGRFAGLDVAQMGIDVFSSSVMVIDLKTGRSVATAPATSPEHRAESFVTVHGMVIDPAGTLAWIGERSAVGALTPVYEVRTLGRAGDRLLDSGAHIRPGSLTLHGRLLGWEDTTQRTSQLSP